MKYSICSIAKSYVRAFYRFVSVRPGTGYNSDRFDLFMYCIKTVCGLEVTEYSDIIRMYGDSCVRCLSEVKGVPKNIKELPLSDRLDIVSMCKAYSVFSDISLGGMKNE